MATVLVRGIVTVGRYIGSSIYRLIARKVEVEYKERPADLHEIDFDDVTVVRGADENNPREFLRKKTSFLDSQNPEVRLRGLYKYYRKIDPERRKGAWLVRNILYREDLIFSKDNFLSHWRGNYKRQLSEQQLQNYIQGERKRYDKDLPFYESLLREGGLFHDKNSFAEYFFNHAFEFYYEDRFNDIENLYKTLKRLHPEIEYHLDTTFGDQWLKDFKIYLKDIGFAKPVPRYLPKATRVRIPQNYFVTMKHHFVYKMGGVEYANHPIWLERILPLLGDEGEDDYSTKFYEIATKRNTDLSLQFEELFYSKNAAFAKNPHNIFFTDEDA